MSRIDICFCSATELVLQLANAFEHATGFWKRRPPVVLESA